MHRVHESWRNYGNWRASISLNRSVITGLKWATGARILAQVLTWASTFLVIRVLSPADFGLAALAGVFAGFLTLLNELGFSTALVQRQTRDQETLRHVFGALLLTGAVLMLALIAVAPLIGSFVREPRVVPLLRLASLQFLAMSIGVIPQARLSMDLKFKEISIASVIAALIGAAATLTAALQGGGAWSLIIGVVVLSLSRATLLNVYSPSIFAPRLNYAQIRDLAGFSGLVLVTRTLWYWYMQVDTLVIGRALGAAELGVYSVARQLTSIPLERAMDIINTVTLPAYSLVKSDLDQVRRGYLKVFRLGACYAFPVFWGLAAVSAPTVRLIIGEKWLPSVPVIELLCVSMPLRMLNSLTWSVATSLARQDVNIKSLVLAIVVIPVCVIIGSHWGVVGVAAAWTVGFPVVYLYNSLLLRRALVLPTVAVVRATWPSLAGAVAMLAVIETLNRLYLDAMAPLLHLVIAVPAGIVVFSLVLWVVSRSSAMEMVEFMRSMLSAKSSLGGDVGAEPKSAA